MKFTPATITLGVVLSAALAACGQPLPVPVQADSPLVTLSLHAPLTAQGLKAQGLPSDASGLSVVSSVKVKVWNADHQLMTFDAGNVYQSGGQNSFLTLTPAQPNLKLLLPRGAYTFESIGRASDNTFLAYGKTAQTDLTLTQSVGLTLHTLIDPGALALTLDGDPATVEPDTTYTARLKALTPLVNGVRYPVPTSDFDAPVFSPDQADVVSASKLGTVVKTVTTPTAQFALIVQTAGWVASADPDNPEQASEDDTLTTIVTKPFSGAGVP